jgi:hypothetical protein
LNFKDVWKGLRDLVGEVKTPQEGFTHDPWGKMWRFATNKIFGKNDRFKREQASFDDKFEQYFAAQATASSLSFVKETMSPASVQLMSFGSSTGHTDMDIISTTRHASWPRDFQPALPSRWLLCFGRLAAAGSAEVDPPQMSKHCTGFFNREDTLQAITGLGTSLTWDDTSLFRDRTLFHTRMEILYGSSSGDSVQSAFNLVGWDRSSKGLARTIAKLVRERIAREGLKCPG